MRFYFFLKIISYSKNEISNIFSCDEMKEKVSNIVLNDINLSLTTSKLTFVDMINKPISTIAISSKDNKNRNQGSIIDTIYIFNSNKYKYDNT
jgi:hypothetical protein